MEDYDCGASLICWYENGLAVTSDLKICMTRTVYGDGSIIGWKSIYSDDYQDGINVGRVCTSGWAYKKTTNEAECFTILKVQSDQGEFTVDTAPYPCTASNTANFCMYFYGTGDSDFLIIKCQRGLDGSSGYCPAPGPTETLALSASMNALYTNQTNCHTLDRENMFAYAECGAGAGVLLELAATNKLNFEYWPYIQGSNPKTCIESVIPLSYVKLI